MSNLIEEIRRETPLIHNITNQVVMNFTANGLYAIGASPVMAHAKEEVEEMAQISNALVLNIGTLTLDQVDAMVLAGKAANKVGIPVVLDPVGVGATKFRTESARRILEKVDITVVRGNAGEISNLAGVDLPVKGVDGAEGIDTEKLAKKAYENIQVPLVITGKIDIVIDNDNVSRLSNGDPMLTKVTGAGCLLSSVIAAFLAVSDNPNRALEDALCFYGIAAEKAAKLHQKPGSFQMAFLDQLYDLRAEEIEKKKRIARS